MAALTPTRPTAAGVAWSPQAVSSSDTISSSVLGSRGAILVVTNGGGSDDSVEVSDSGLTPAGNPADTTPVNVAAGTSVAIRISPRAVDPSTGVVTVTHSQTSDVTYVLVPVE